MKTALEIIIVVSLQLLIFLWLARGYTWVYGTPLRWPWKFFAIGMLLFGVRRRDLEVNEDTRPSGPTLGDVSRGQRQPPHSQPPKY